MHAQYMHSSHLHMLVLSIFTYIKGSVKVTLNINYYKLWQLLWFFSYKLGKSAIKSRDCAAVSSVKFTVMHLVSMLCIGTLLKDASDCLQNEQGMYGVQF